MNLIDIIKEKRFIGQEFLTWLLFQSDLNSGIVNIEGMGSAEIWFEDRLVLEHGLDLFRQKVTCQGKDLGLMEAFTALREGKKVSQARLRLSFEDLQWRLTILADTFEITGIRLPKSVDDDDESDVGAIGGLLDRVSLTSQLLEIIDKLFAQFIRLRTSPAWDETEIMAMRRWIKS